MNAKARMEGELDETTARDLVQQITGVLTDCDLPVLAASTLRITRRALVHHADAKHESADAVIREFLVWARAQQDGPLTEVHGAEDRHSSRVIEQIVERFTKARG